MSGRRPAACIKPTCSDMFTDSVHRWVYSVHRWVYSGRERAGIENAGGGADSLRGDTCAERDGREKRVGGPMVGAEALWWARRPCGGHRGPVVGTAAVMGMVGTEAVLVGAKAVS